MSATVAAALKKIAVAILTDPKLRKTVLGIVLGILLIIVMPIVAVVSVFNGGIEIDTDRLQQMVEDRKTPLLAFAKEKGCSIADLDMQLAFLCRELETKFPGVLTALQNARSVREASDYVLFHFETPADQGASAASMTESAGFAAVSRICSDIWTTPFCARASRTTIRTAASSATRSLCRRIISC